MTAAARLAGLVSLATAMLVWMRHDLALARLMYVDLHMNDFGKVYYAARHFLAGQSMYGPSPATLMPVGHDLSHQFWNLNPPHAHLVVLPLAVLEPLPAVAIWAAVNLLALVASLTVMARELGLRWTPPRVGLVLAVVALSSATGAVFATGQMTALLMLPVTLAWRALRRGESRRAGAWLGLAASVKPFLGIFVAYFLWQRQREAWMSMLAAISGAFATGLVVFGVSSHRSWFGVLGEVDWVWAAMNGSLPGLIARGLAPSPYFTPLVDWSGLVTPLSWVAAGAAVVLSAAALRRPAGGVGVDATFATLLLTAQVASPLGWIYYLPLAAGPLTALWRAHWSGRVRRPPWWMVLALPGLVVPISVTVLRGDLAWYSLTVGSAYAWTTVALWCGCVSSVRSLRASG